MAIPLCDAEGIMPDYLLLMHNDPTEAANDRDWAIYLQALARTGKFRGGSAIGGGVCRRKSGAAPAIAAQIGGFIRIEADSLADAEALLTGNPVFENGGTVEIRELPKGA
jgi:YCII-related domain-containing protein